MDLSGLVAADVEALFVRRDYFSINHLWGLSSQQNFSSRVLHIFAYSSLVTIQKSKLIDILRSIVKANSFERLTALMCSKILPSPWGSLYLSLSTGTSHTTIGADLEQLFQELPDLSSKFGFKYECFYDVGSSRYPSWPLTDHSEDDALVVCWEANSNAMGRAYVLATLLTKCGYKTTVVAPMVQSIDCGIWRPLIYTKRTFKMKILSYRDAHEYFDAATDFARQNNYAVVYVSKTRFQSVFIGWLYQQKGNCKLICDVDDYEPGFYGEQRSLSEWVDGMKRLEVENMRLNQKNFDGLEWLAIAEQLADDFTFFTGPNNQIGDAYQDKQYQILDHCREHSKQTVVAQSLPSKREGCIRILFNGTLRSHKGVDRLIQEISSYSNQGESFELVLFNQPTIDFYVGLCEKYGVKLLVLDNVSIEENIQICRQADVLCLMQDKDNIISDYQSPAKVVDALIADIPVIAYQTKPLLELAARGYPIVFIEECHDFLSAIKQAMDRRSTSQTQALGDELTFDAQAQVLGGFINTASDQPLARENPSPIAWLKQTYCLDISIPNYTHETSQLPKFPIPLVMFWRYHDTGLYPRRHHSLALQLAEDERISHVMHWESPLSIQGLSQSQVEPGFTQRQLNRYEGRYDKDDISYRTFIYDYHSSKSINNSNYQPVDGFMSYYKDKLKSRMITSPYIAWIYPPFTNLATLLPELRQQYIVTDFVDSAILEYEDVKQKQVVIEQYKLLGKISHLCVVNCKPMADLLTDFGIDNPLIVENAYPVRNFSQMSQYQLQPRRKQLIYTGNMNGRINWKFICDLCEQCSDFNIVLYGDSLHDFHHYERRYPNLKILPSVRPELLPGLFSDGSLALIPHQDNEKTKHMNLIKYYEYRSLGIPVITTSRFNLPSLDHIYYISDPKEFRGVYDSLSLQAEQQDAFKASSNFYKEHSWETRKNLILQTLFERIGLPKAEL